MEAFITPFPSTAERTIAERMPGKAIIASTNLIRILSIIWGESAASAPNNRPNIVPIKTDDVLTARAERVETRIRENISLPNWSVPNKWEEEGGENLFFVSI